MYKHIYIPVDNSRHSNFGIELGTLLAKKYDSSLTGSHVYAAALHDSRFKQMEGGLPDKYKIEEELFKQREVHDTLIDKGLKVISDSFLDVFEKRCKDANRPYTRRILEGKNFRLLVEDINSNDYDLVIIGVLGLGAVEDSLIGSVCERVVRRVKTDTFVVKSTEPFEEGRTIAVGIDGSPQSYWGLIKAIELAKSFNLKVNAISAFDPYYHYVAFNSIVDVLSEDAAEVFKFEEQEKLHEEIIDSGLAQIYQTHLNTAQKIAEKQGFEITTTLLDGKPFDKILKYVRDKNPWLLVLGRIGVHCDSEMDIGSNTENLLRLCPSNILVTSGEFRPPIEISEMESNIAWTKESEQRLTRIPSFAQNMAKKAIYQYAIDNRYTIITSDVIDSVMNKFMPNPSSKKSGGKPHHSTSDSKNQNINWTEEAQERLKELFPTDLIKPQRLRVEKYAIMSKQHIIEKNIVDKALGKQPGPK